MMKKTMYFVYAILMMNFCLSFGKVHKIGDSSGWGSGQIHYMSWAAQKNFEVGDTIVFEYNKEDHNVVQVTHKNFNACNATAPYSTWATGNDTFHIKRPGHFYFICGIPGHCQAGMKVDIRVPKSHAPIATPPAPSPTYPAPSPVPRSPMSPAPRPMKERPWSPTPSPVPESPMSPAPSPVPKSPISPAPSPLSPISSAPSPLPQSPMSPSPSSLPESPMSPSPSPVPNNPMSPPPSLVPESPMSPAPSPSSCSSMYSSLRIWKIVVSFSLCFLVALWN